jgi:hypothetical protein
VTVVSVESPVADRAWKKSGYPMLRNKYVCERAIGGESGRGGEGAYCVTVLRESEGAYCCGRVAAVRV